MPAIQAAHMANLGGLPLPPLPRSRAGGEHKSLHSSPHRSRRHHSDGHTAGTDTARGRWSQPRMVLVLSIAPQVASGAASGLPVVLPAMF